MLPDLERLMAVARAMPAGAYRGTLSKVVGLLVEARGLRIPLGELATIELADASLATAEVVGFRGSASLLMPLGDVVGLRPGACVAPLGRKLLVPVGPGLLGRVLDGLGRPIDGKGAFDKAAEMPLWREAPNPLDRVPIDQVLPTGISVIDAFMTLGRGQRIGIFAGSGVGKSTLLAEIARETLADVNVIVLVGERGREVRAFIDEALGEAGLKRSILVVATSDAPPLLRIKATFTAVAIAEFFRDLGQDVMFMCDSVTRLAAATREVGLALGEPPTVKGYPPSFFSTMPKVVERLGRTGQGSITGLFTVLVDADDLNEPVADTMRGLLDGHVVLSRRVANRGHFPAVSVLESISRLMPKVASPEHLEAARAGREILAAYEEARDLIAVGAYKTGSDPQVDRAVATINDLDALLCQPSGQGRSLDETVGRLRRMMELETGPR